MHRTPMAAVLAASALVLAACGGGGEETGAAAGDGGGEALSVVYVPGLTGNPFYSTVGCGGRDRAAELGVDFSVQGSPTFDVAAQTSVVNAIVANAPDALMISVTDATAMAVPLTEAKDAGVDIITIDGDLEDTSIGSANIQSDNLEGGRLAAENLGKLLNGQGEVLAINQTPGNPIGELREQGFAEGLKAFPGITYLGVQYDENATATAASIASGAASSNPNLKGIYTMATNSTEGAITGVREAGRTGDVKVVGYDTSEPIIQALEDGAVDGIVVQYPYREGALGVDAAVALSKDEEVERNQTVPFVFATPENVATPEVQEYLYKVDC
ncbi:ABC transporter substrate-binding protein [Modestobacter sp. VKM Ac-2986]|uniref:ABC transporter substrate-binding protein n=1 Tax=Modestobacter sp. VKM Ac-2986 TaxID=3004140 RepID=UPI0022AA1DB0|nr:ABC transporter substrate-binding protein [Modestobacter sp. VKM Ac-2986]MCZ2827719.1 ABC transporter substrate-binding protein [Modestobacter sp. VKM Ac-2986]